MVPETSSEIPVIYKVVLVLIFIFLLNKLFAKFFKDLKVPFIARVVENRPNVHNANSVPVRSEFIEEFLTALQNKRNRIITELKSGSVLAESARSKMRELFEVENKLWFCYSRFISLQQSRYGRLRLYFNNMRKMMKTYISLLMQAN